MSYTMGELTAAEIDFVAGAREMGFFESVGFVIDNPFTGLGMAADFVFRGGTQTAGKYGVVNWKTGQ